MENIRTANLGKGLEGMLILDMIKQNEVNHLYG